MKEIISLTNEKKELENNIKLLKESLEKLDKKRNENNRYIVKANMIFSSPPCINIDDKRMQIYLDDDVIKAIIRNLKKKVKVIDAKLSVFDYDNK